MQFTNGNTTNYVYDAAGQKLSVTHQTAVAGMVIPMTNVMKPLTNAQISQTFKTDYCGNVIYENGAVSKILTEEGYITFSGSTPVYHYYLKDHQGNNRVVINQVGIVEQVNHYYPFGGLMGESTAGGVQPYKYNGKELDRMHGLDLFDYGARHYDAAIGRWWTVDPLAEKNYSSSTYNYTTNNPIRYIDLFGLDTIPVNNLSTEWYNFNPNKDIVSLDEVSITVKNTSTINKISTISNYGSTFLGTLGEYTAYKRNIQSIEIYNSIFTQQVYRGQISQIDGYGKIWRNANNSKVITKAINAKIPVITKYSNLYGKGAGVLITIDVTTSMYKGITTDNPDSQVYYITEGFLKMPSLIPGPFGIIYGVSFEKGVRPIWEKGAENYRELIDKGTDPSVIFIMPGLGYTPPIRF